VTNPLYVVEQTGRVRIVQRGRVTGTLVRVPGVVCCGEQGLLSVAFHPRFAKNRRYFVYYTAPANRVVEYRGSRRVRTLLNVADPYSNHNGGQLMFGPDGRLYVGMGDAGSGGDPENRAQNPASRFGKLLAINVDKRGARWQMVALGLRNPWRYSFDRKTGDLYIGDVGQGSFEEVDRITEGQGGWNLGWSCKEAFATYDASRCRSGATYRDPVAAYGRDYGSSITGGFVYRGDRFADLLGGHYVAGDFGSGRVFHHDGVQIVTAGRLPGVTSFGEDGTNELWAVTYDGGLHRMGATA
jgi:glucose/arabinose dehydrogenase